MIEIKQLRHHTQRLLWVLFLTISPLLCQIAIASPLAITATPGSYTIGPQLSVLEDANGQLSIQDIISQSGANRFTPLESDRANFGYSDSAYWFRFNLHNTTNTHRKLLLEVGYPLLDDIRFYSLTNGTIDSQLRAGDLLPFEQRGFNYQNIIFNLELPALANKTIYLRVKTESSVQVPLTLWDPSAFAEHINKTQLGLGVYYGTMLVMVLYNLFLFISVRDRVYFFYVTYIASFIVTQMALNGLAYEYLWSKSPTIANQSISFLVLTVNLTAALFWRSFLNLKVNAPRLYTLSSVLIFIGICGFFLAIFSRYSISIRYSIVLTLVNCTVGIIAGVYCWRLKVPTANYYVIAWLFFLLGSIIKSLTMLGILPSIFITDYAQQIGSSMEVILLSLGLADRINHLKRDASNKQERYLQLKIRSTEEEIAARQSMLETQAESNKLKDAFLTTISHEMRTPMNGVLGAIELIKTRTLDKQLKEDIELAEASAGKMISLVDRVLDFAQIQSGMSELSNRPFDMHQALEITCRPFALESQQRGIQLSTNFEDLQDKIMTGDVDKIVSIVRLILDNAVKFSEKGEIHCSATISESQRIRISIADQGMGIDPKCHQTIFEPFQQVDASFHRNHEGLGIGLSTAQALAALLDSHIEVSSKLGSGSTFSFCLDIPIEEKNTDLQNTEKANILPNDPSSSLSATLTAKKPAQAEAHILIVEDNKVNQLILNKMITSLGYRTAKVENGKEAVSYVRQNHVDLILMDCQMPIMNGFDATNEIRHSNGNNKNVPIIAVTANVTDQDKKKIFQCGMNDLVAKPVNLEKIQSKIKVWLHKSAALEKATV